MHVKFDPKVTYEINILNHNHHNFLKLRNPGYHQSQIGNEVVKANPSGPFWESTKNMYS